MVGIAMKPVGPPLGRVDRRGPEPICETNYAPIGRERVIGAPRFLGRLAYVIKLHARVERDGNKIGVGLRPFEQPTA